MKNFQIKTFTLLLTIVLFCILSFFLGYKTNQIYAYKKIKILESQIKRQQKDIDALIGINMPSVYPREDTIPFDDFLYEDYSKKEKEARFNLFGEIEYKNKIVLNEKGHPLTIKNANSSAEIIMIAITEGVKPEKGCNLDKNGTLGCYWYYFFDGKKKNYWEK